jgi:AcrR family transcriptional regulator
MRKTHVPNGSARKASPEPRELIWERIERRAKTGSAKPVVERMVRLAMAVADREGLEALSMRRVAAEMQSGVMSLYYYVPGKGELLDLLLDEAIGEMQMSAGPSGDWRKDLRVLALRTRACLKRHPWALLVLHSRPAIGPNRLAQTDFALGVLSPLRLDHKMIWRAVGSFYLYILGSVALELSEAHTLRRAGFGRTVQHYLDDLFASGKCPNLARFHAQGTPPLPDDETFEDGLDLVLDGIATLCRAK